MCFISNFDFESLFWFLCKTFLSHQRQNDWLWNKSFQESGIFLSRTLIQLMYAKLQAGFKFDSKGLERIIWKLHEALVAVYSVISQMISKYWISGGQNPAHGVVFSPTFPNISYVKCNIKVLFVQKCGQMVPAKL